VPRNSLFVWQGISAEAFEFTRLLGIKDVAKVPNLQNFPDKFLAGKWEEETRVLDCILSQPVRSLWAMSELQK
jgi:hypothetical protein